MAAAKSAPSEGKGATSKMHRRSRSGCFTCRLRRKKCEEGRPSCKACRHLGLRCDYKRPMWWSSGEQRRAQKENIKNIIKRTQLSKKNTAAQRQEQQQPPPPLQHHPSATPQGFYHSVPSSVDCYHESMPQSSDPSEGSPYSTGYDFPHTSPDGYFQMPPPPQPLLSHHPQYPAFSPYEIDIKTERQIFVNDVPTRRDSTISTFSTFQPPPSADGMPDFPADSWVQQEHHESFQESFTEEPVDFNFFQFPHGSMSPNHEAVIDVADCDKYLLNHFLDRVLKLIFPILDANQHGSARTDVILPALESNVAYLHCCLSVAATHMKATDGLSGDIDNDICRHRYAAVSSLCEALGNNVDHSGILEATLGMIFFQCSVGRPDDALPDIPWHQHFQAATDLVQRLDLTNAVIDHIPGGHLRPPFNMTLASWIDILGSTMLCRVPTFADTYRALNTVDSSAGLSELMGCDDKIMFLISEIACLDAQKAAGLDESVVCSYVKSIADEIAKTEIPPGEVQSCFSSTGAIRPRQLGVNITAVFGIAARIYLLALVPGSEPSQPGMCHLVSQLSALMNFIPAGPDGFDRSVAWPLLIAGANSVAASSFRPMFAERCERLGDGSQFGSFGRIRELLKDVWQINDNAEAKAGPGVHWRDVMQQKGWDYLLI